MSESETPVDAPARRPRRPWVVPVAALVFIVSATAILTVRAKLKERRRQKAIAAVKALGQVAMAQSPASRLPWPLSLLSRPHSYVHTVWLEGSPADDATLAHLECFSDLQYIDLNGTNVGDAGLVHLKGLTGLETLDLGDTSVTDVGLVHLKGLTGLQVLYLSDTKVRDAGLVHLKGLTKLKQLFLSNTQVTDAGLVHLRGLSCPQ